MKGFVMWQRSALALLNGLIFMAVQIETVHGQEAKSADSDATSANVLTDPNFFPIAVWLQNPAKAAEYRAAGINLYVGLWRGPTEEQLATLKANGIRVICSQNSVGLQHKDDPTIIAWMHGDEPDNAQAIPGKKGYGPPILPARIAEDYQRMKKTDPSRPVLLNLGQGVAWDQYIGRGLRRNHPEDYPEYIQGCDIVSFDIYPAVHDHAGVAGKLWFVADGVSRLRKWSGEKPVWNCIECTHISNEKTKATPDQVKAEVWMSLIRGSRGIIYFVHQFKPRFIEAALLVDAPMLAKVTAINHQIQQLAPVLNSATIEGAVTVESSPDVPVEAMLKRHQKSRYIFAVAMRDAPTKAKFQIQGAPQNARLEVLGENRQIECQAGSFSDDFKPWGVHLYRMDQ
jgi:hypothetical protein